MNQVLRLGLLIFAGAFVASRAGPRQPPDASTELIQIGSGDSIPVGVHEHVKMVGEALVSETKKQKMRDI